MGHFIMGIKFKNYNYGYRIVSLALNEDAKNELIAGLLPLVFVDTNKKEIVLLPEGIVLSKEEADLEIIVEYNNFDVFELWETGLFVRRYNDKSDDNYLFMTSKCNSNCIMCPSSEHSRKAPSDPSLSHLYELAKHIPDDVPHLTITGGEPFLVGEEIFPFLQYLKERFSNTEFLFLTNGRIFAIDKYLQLFCETAPYNSLVAIPLHGSCQQIHDAITRADGSFKQTVLGIRRLLARKTPVEVRIVVSKINVDDFENLAKLIVEQFGGVEYVSVIAMEMTGTARVNLDQVWISYNEAFSRIAAPIRYMVKNGVDVKLYNFPLCTVTPPFWTLCEKSISDNKVRFAEQCDDCKYKSSCSGVFAGTLQLERDELKPIS